MIPPAPPHVHAGLQSRHAAPRLRRVLVVDDDPAILELVGTQLQGAGYEVETASDGEEAWALLSDVGRPVPDVIVTDARMPNRTGPELLREVGLDLRFNGVRTILMSMDATAGANVQCHAFMLKERVPCDLIATLLRLEETSE